MYRRKSGSVGAAIIGIVLFIALICTIVCIEKIPVGYEGVMYSMSGGVKDETLTQGWHIVPPTIKVKEFTVSNEQLILTQDKREGSKEDESFKVATSDDASISIDFQMSYRFIPEKLVETYKKFKGMDGNDIVQNRVRTVLKSKVSEITTDYSLMDIYSGNRSEINNKLTEYLNDEFSDAYGINVLDASIIDSHPDSKLQETIDARVKAQQAKAQAEAEQKEVEVKAKTALIQAQGEAAVIVEKAKAEAEANNTIAASITDELIRMKEAEARYIHGWVTVNGSNSVITDARESSKTTDNKDEESKEESKKESKKKE